MKRGYVRGYQFRQALSGAQAGVHTPNRFGAASASATRSRAAHVSSAMITSAVFSCTCWNCSIPIASVSSDTSPRMNSVFAFVRVDDLVGHVRGGARLRVDAVAELGLPDDEAALVRDEDVVEDHDRVDLLEARPERVVEVAAAEVEALAAQEAHARRVARQRERVGVRRVVLRALEHGRRHHEDLVRERPDRGQDPRASDHDAVVVPVDDARRERLVLLLRRADASGSPAGARACA